jgi:hypothetical protein
MKSLNSSMRSEPAIVGVLQKNSNNANQIKYCKSDLKYQ